ncbi:hypothetical protein CIPAW_09G220000 [Carya illinoinensis]|uniref:Uncharacterized protein n=1 Tax=Carya illinoinensis TaxID=32201 RepID=A0A8T1PQJ4_CARIL|nr:hypothetical protein CIPAW_09G220000 [Carya illinoinensis]
MIKNFWSPPPHTSMSTKPSCNNLLLKVGQVRIQLSKLQRSLMNFS